jgi:hypothetical protein
MYVHIKMRRFRENSDIYFGKEVLLAPQMFFTDSMNLDVF